MKHFVVNVLAFSVTLLGSETLAQEINLGAEEYALSCAQCHGSEGNGDGYLADSFAIAVPNLTIIKSRNDGNFPTSDIYQLVMNGSWGGKVHSAGNMPVWGLRYAVDAAESLGESAAGTSMAVEKEVHERVAALVNHIYRLQSPGADDLDASIAVLEEQIPDILLIPPDNLEIVLTLPQGYRATAAIVDLYYSQEDGRNVEGSGEFDLEVLGVRDLVGNHTQTSFGFAESDRAYASKLLGNRKLAAELEAKLLSEAQNDERRDADSADIRIGANIWFDACFDGGEEIDNTGFPTVHLRDLTTSATLFQIQLPISISILGSQPCQ